jgi:uncharacterized protein
VVDLVAEFRINISNLSEGIHEYFFEAEPSKIGLDERFTSTVKVKAKLDKSLHQILVLADVHAGADFICDRCLADFCRHLDTGYSMVYIQRDRSTVDAKKEEEIHVLSSDANYIDLDEDVRQYVLLTVPQKLLCREECQGLCPTCGVNRNCENCACCVQVADSRWDTLKKLSHN